MPTGTRSTSTAPELYPLPHYQPVPRRRPAPAIMATTEWTENPMNSNFNPGTAAAQKIFLEKTKGLPEDKRLPLTSSSAKAIMAVLRGKGATHG